MPSVSGYLSTLVIPGFGGVAEQWMNKVGVVEPVLGGGEGDALSPACFTIIDISENLPGSSLVDTAAFVDGSLLCFRKTSEFGSGCGVSLEVKPEFSTLKPERATFSFQGGAYGYSAESYFEFSVFDSDWNALGSFSFSGNQTEPFDLTETVILDYESYSSSGISFINVFNESMAF